MKPDFNVGPEEYVVGVVGAAQDAIPSNRPADNAALPFVLLGFAGVPIFSKIMQVDAGVGEMLSVDMLGAMGLLVLASLCWLCE